METTKKTCFKCHQSLPLSAFYKHKSMKDGRLNKCKECTKKDAYKSRHVDHRERTLKHERERSKRPERMESAKLIHERWKEQNPERRAAQVAVGNAVRSKKIIPLPCFICGEKAEAHHPDYSSSLDVVWLCPAHHRQTHALIKKVA